MLHRSAVISETTGWRLHFAALGDDNVGCRPVKNAARILDLAHDIHSVDDLAEGYVLAV